MSAKNCNRILINLLVLLFLLIVPTFLLADIKSDCPDLVKCIEKASFLTNKAYIIQIGTGEKFSLEASSNLKLMRESDFPQRIALTDNNKRFGWMESEVDSWLLGKRDLAHQRAELSKHGK